MAILLGVFLFGTVRIRPKNQPAGDIIYIEIVEPTPPPPPKPQPKVQEAPRHEKFATRDNSQQVEGKAEETRTVNSRALFKMSKSGVDKPADAGNPYAKSDTVAKAAGKGGGLNPVGTSSLDEGLVGRGLVGALPRPKYPAGNKSGKVIIRVVVNAAGQVTQANYEPKGSTTSDADLVAAARAAALRARFTEAETAVMGGCITYLFTMK